jgi:aspartate aminotransferase-like enzyme
VVILRCETTFIFSSNRYLFSLETYGAKVTQLGVAVGFRPTQEAIKEAVSKTHYKFVTVTHVDTS